MQHLTSPLSYLRGRFGRDEEGATMVEYGLLVALIAVVVIVALQVLGPGIAGLFEDVNDQLPVTQTDGNTD